MSTGVVLTQHQPNTNCNLDESLSSNSIFNKSTFANISPHPDHTQFNSLFSEPITTHVRNINNEQIYESNSYKRFLEDKVNYQQFEIVRLHEIVHDLYKELNYLSSVVHSTPQPPILYSRPHSTKDCTNKYDYHQNADLFQSVSPTSIRSPREPNTPQVAQTTHLHHVNTSMNNDQTRFLKEVLYKLDAAIEHRDAQINDLRNDINDIRHSQLNSTKNSHTPTFIPIINSVQPPSVATPTNVSQNNPSSSKNHNEGILHRDDYNILNINNNQHTYSQNESHVTPKFDIQNMKTKSSNNSRWCSFCSTASHTRFYCHFNTNDSNYQSERNQNLQQHEESLSSYCSQNQHSYQPLNSQVSNQNELLAQQYLQQQPQQQVSLPYSSMQLPLKMISVHGSR